MADGKVNGVGGDVAEANSGLTDIITNAENMIITRTAPSPIYPTPTAQVGSASTTVGPDSTFPEPSADPLDVFPPAPTTAAACVIEPTATRVRMSRSFKRDSGLAVEESPINSKPTPAFAASASSPAHVSPRQTKWYTPSLNGGASIGAASTCPSTILTPEDELASRRVRSLYDSGSDIQSSYSRRGGADSDAGSMGGPGGRAKRISRGVRNSLVVTDEEGNTTEIGGGTFREEEEFRHANSRRGVLERRDAGEARNDSLEINEVREQYVCAGGMEDWEDVDGNDVDRYGFIKPEASGSVNQQRRSTSLYMPSNAPRRMRSRRGQPLRLLVNSFEADKPYEMLQSPMPWAKDENREKEIERAKKWQTMAESTVGGTKVSRWRRTKSAEKLAEGDGWHWRFATKDPKLISRTWKGIPDCWRAAAWHSFLTASAEKKGNCLRDDELKHIYQELCDRGCADDVQIDLDVPRTISSHVMFRRRYGGGQRLLFRVLHALTLHFPEVGYVQGMAPIAATLLCYYDEETAFIMLVRLWELRGLGKIYEPGFGGLMEALDELEKKWLKGGQAAEKLELLSIGPMAYGTRWYLTLFNYSMPFAAQLRVWDVFMLLGDPDPSLAKPRSRRASFAGLHFRQFRSNGDVGDAQVSVGFAGTLDVLHATSTALIDGMKDLLLAADFENAMKLVTGWIPVKDEDLLMKVAKGEWRTKRRRRFLVGSGGSRVVSTASTSSATSSHKHK